MNDRIREGNIYLVLSQGRYSFDLRVDKATNKKPRATPEGSIVVKVKLRVPNKAFEPIAPEVVVTVPEELVQHPIEVEAADATDD